MRALPVGGDQPADAGRPWPVFHRQPVGDAAHGDQHGPGAVEPEIVAAAERGNRADLRDVAEFAHRHAGGDAQESPGAVVGGEHFAVDRRGPRFMAEEMGEEVGPVERAQAQRRDSRPCRAGQRQVADVGEDPIRRERREQGGFTRNPRRPVGMGQAIGGGGGGEVDAHGVDHHVAEIAAARDQGKGHLDALRQFLPGEAAAHGQPQIRGHFRQGVEGRGGDREVAEAMTRNVDEQVHQVVALVIRPFSGSTVDIPYRAAFRIR